MKKSNRASYKSVSGYAIEREDGSLAAFIPDSDYISDEELLNSIRNHPQLSEAIQAAGMSLDSLTVIKGARCCYRKEWTQQDGEDNQAS